jgi:hypothetical protein
MEKQFQLFFKFLGPSVTIVGNVNLLVKLENESSSLKVYLHKLGMKK